MGGALVAKHRSWIGRVFPERQLLLQSEGRVRYLTLSSRLQMSVAGIALCGVGVAAQMAFGDIRMDRLWALLRPGVEQAASTSPAPPPEAAAAARGELEETRVRMAIIELARDHALAERDELQRRMSTAEEALASKSNQLAELNKQLDSKGHDQRLTEAQQASLQSRVRALESELQGTQAHATQYKSALDTAEHKLQQLAHEHDQMAAERDKLRARIAELEAKLSKAEAAARNEKLGAAEGDRAPSGANPTPSLDPEPPRGTLAQLESVIAATGVDVEKLLSRLAAAPALEGGPFVAFEGTKDAAAPDDVHRLQMMQKLVKTLPLGTPLREYQVESIFGKRRDPFNRRWAFHNGLDLSAPYRTPVLSTGPGVIKFAGVKHGFGKVVEVDHGNGISTLYGHLHRIVVSRGQKVSKQQQIGELGSTGRSTGPHVHYEIRVDGVARDPAIFIEAGKNVVQASKE